MRTFAHRKSSLMCGSQILPNKTIAILKCIPPLSVTGDGTGLVAFHPQTVCGFQGDVSDCSQQRFIDDIVVLLSIP